MEVAAQPKAHFNLNNQEVITSQQRVFKQRRKGPWLGRGEGSGSMPRTEKRQSWMWDEGRREEPHQNLGCTPGNKPSTPQATTVRKSIVNTQPYIVGKEAKLYFYKLLANVKRSLLSQKYELPPRQISWGKRAVKIDFLMDRKTMCLCFRSSNFVLPP